MINEALENPIPCLPFNGIIPFERIVLHVDMGSGNAEAAVKAALKSESRLIFITLLKDIRDGNPEIADVGIIAEAKQIIKTGNSTRAVLDGKFRGKLLGVTSRSPIMTAKVKKLSRVSAKCDPLELEAVIRSIKDVFVAYAALNPTSPHLISSILTQKDPFTLFELISLNIQIQNEDRQILLEKNNILEKLTILYAILSGEAEMAKLQNNITNKVQQSFDKSQRVHLLRESIREIRKELGEIDGAGQPQKTPESYSETIKAIVRIDDESREKLLKEAQKLETMPIHSGENYSLENYLETVTALPWDSYTEDNDDIGNAEEILNSDHYGLKKVKERILELLSVRTLKPDVKGQIICLAGPPGVGKTSVAKSIAKALGRSYQRVSLGGVRDEADIRGHRKTYIGAMPGRIINAVSLSGSRNPLILLDEIDKVAHDGRGDPASALLEVLDSEQNHAFRDHYVEVPFDLSDVLFVTTANNIGEIEKPLLDRMEVVELNSYTAQEKFHIAKDHLIDKQLSANGLRPTQLKFTDEAIQMVIDSYTREAGVRTLERTIASLCRKAAKDIVSGNRKRISLTSKLVNKYLGSPRYDDIDTAETPEVGVVNGLAWTSVGGVIMPLEALVIPEGKGDIVITGSLGEVMKESAQIAVTYCRTIADRYSIPKNFYKESDIHIHAPEGATPKDGPSAGVTMVTSLVSALSGIPVRNDIAMTGEITLHGKVLPIGGLREKLTAAYKSGIKTVIIPKKNAKDLEDVDIDVLESIEIVFAEEISDVLSKSLLPRVSRKETPKSIYKNKKPEYSIQA
ncbi:MAG: endopeptidase La [Ruminococcus sp.]|jgi:ATP-dependent Lon protease|nr:endopeptidase La [Ruminococcus sp.]